MAQLWRSTWGCIVGAAAFGTLGRGHGVFVDEPFDGVGAETPSGSSR